MNTKETIEKELNYLKNSIKAQEQALETELSSLRRLEYLELAKTKIGKYYDLGHFKVHVLEQVEFRTCRVMLKAIELQTTPTYEKDRFTLRVNYYDISDLDAPEITEAEFKALSSSVKEQLQELLDKL